MFISNLQWKRIFSLLAMTTFLVTHVFNFSNLYALPQVIRCYYSIDPFTNAIIVDTCVGIGERIEETPLDTELDDDELDQGKISAGEIAYDFYGEDLVNSHETHFSINGQLTTEPVDYSSIISSSTTAYVQPASDSPTGQPTLVLSTNIAIDEIEVSSTTGSLWNENEDIDQIPGAEEPIHDICLCYWGWHDNQLTKMYNKSNELNDLEREFDTKSAEIDEMNARVPEINSDLESTALEFVNTELDRVEKLIEKATIESAHNEEVERAKTSDSRASDIANDYADNKFYNQSYDERKSQTDSLISSYDRQIEALLPIIQSHNETLIRNNLPLNGEANKVGEEFQVITSSYEESYDDYYDIVDPDELVGSPATQPDYDTPSAPIDQPMLPSGKPISLDPSHPRYDDIVNAAQYHSGLADEVAASPYEEVRSAHHLAGLGIEAAEHAYANGNTSAGDHLLNGSLTALDAVLDFVPGVSGIKDAIGILTGVNPITGEEISSAERTLMIAGFFAPAVLSGSVKAFTSLSQVLKKRVDDAPGNSPEEASMLNAIEESDAALAPFSKLPCTPVALAPSADTWLGKIKLLAYQVTSYLFNDALANAPCGVGQVTAEHLARFAGKEDQYKALQNTKPGEMTADAADIWKQGSPNYRANYARMTGEEIPAGWHVHHIMPQKFRTQFRNLGIHVDDPRIMVALPSGVHLPGHSRYNAEWEEALGEATSYDDIIDIAKNLVTEYGYTDYLPGTF